MSDKLTIKARSKGNTPQLGGLPYILRILIVLRWSQLRFSLNPVPAKAGSEFRWPLSMYLKRI